MAKLKIPTVTINAWQELLDLQKPRTLYRGQAQADWDLSTSLERSCMRHDGNLLAAKKRERLMCFAFKRHYHSYSIESPDFDDELRWLALMQHHGAPTRLLDWSYSVLVAMYFAVEGSTGDSAVWQIDNSWLRKQATRLLAKGGVKDSSLNVMQKRASREQAKKRFSTIYMSGKHRVVRAISPYYRDLRLTAQQGSFVCPGDVSATFMENLARTGNFADGVTKFVIPQALNRTILYELYAANVSRATLFPGLDGYAGTLNVFHPSVWR